MLREEIFGPVAAGPTFATDDEAVARWPTTPSSGWSPTPSPATSTGPCAVSERLETGMVGVNQRHGVQPGGAVRRGEAVGLRARGRRGGIDEYLETKYVGMTSFDMTAAALATP